MQEQHSNDLKKDFKDIVQNREYRRGQLYRNKLKKAGIVMAMTALLLAQMPSETVLAATPAYIAVESANIRQKPVDGDNITSMPYGSYVEVVDVQQGSDALSWSKVMFTSNGEQIYGWVRSDLITSNLENTSNASDNDTSKKESDTQKAEPTGNLDNDKSDSTEKKEDKTETEDKSTEDKKSEDDTDAAAQGVIIGSMNFDIADGIPEGKVPKGFTEQTVMWNGINYGGAKHDNAEVYLLYLKAQGQGSDILAVCSGTSIYPYVAVPYGDSSLILMENGDSSELPEGSTSAMLALEDGTQINAYEYLGGQDATDFYEVYAMNEDGELSWYSYDSIDKTCQRLNIINNTEDKEIFEDLQKSYVKLKEEKESQKQGFHKIIAGMLILCVVLLFAVINIALGKRRTGSDNEEELSGAALKRKRHAQQREKEKTEPKEKIKKADKMKKDSVEETADTEVRTASNVKEDNAKEKNIKTKVQKTAETKAEKENVVNPGNKKLADTKVSGNKKLADTKVSGKKTSEKPMSEKKAAQIAAREAEIEQRKQLNSGRERIKRELTERVQEKRETQQLVERQVAKAMKPEIERPHVQSAATKTSRFDGAGSELLMHDDITTNPVEKPDDDDLEIMDLNDL